METSQWSIHITADESYSEIEKLLRKTRGYALTHTGVIKRQDSKTFSKEEALAITDGLWVFLSFAHGSHTGISQVEGLDCNGEPSLIQWGPRYTAPWISRQSWCPKMAGGDVLQELFPGFWDLFTQEGWNETIRRVIDWYLHGNESRFVDSSLIFNQVALECLSHRILSGRDSKKAAGYRISKTLKGSGIDDSAIPESMTTLKSLSAKKGWKGGSHAITEMRNSTVHADNWFDGFSLDACFEASELGQWYIELILLSLFGYAGKYRNRLLAVAGSGSYPVENVPWAKQA